jgi:hypothetical protein
MKHLVLATTVAVLTASSSVAVAPAGTVQSKAKAFDEVEACRSIADSAQRLACFDQSVAKLQEAADKQDIMVVDREQVRQTRRSLFGFSVPDLGIFGGGNKADKHTDDRDDVKEITGTVRTARMDGEGNWIVTLDDGAVWHQTDGAVGIAPRAGGQVTIRRAALGSYFLRVGNQPGVKARREN